jgi:uncharacterized lipoprotein YddW (UPF0748 family)
MTSFVDPPAKPALSTGRPLARSLFLSLMVGLTAFSSLLGPTAYAQLAFSVETDKGLSIPVDGKNRPRPDNAIVLYSSEYGKTTRTNPFGVEVVAEKLSGQNRYRVHSIQNVFDCQKKSPNAEGCGNVGIPAGGIVLSASGNRRQVLLEQLKPGSEFMVSETWFSQNSVSFVTINPNRQSNPMGSGFPGFRGGNQLVVYDAGYGQPTTTTNEFGFEVTVVDGRVVAQEGADSTIPPNGFVLSGHGKMNAWLVKNAPIGAKIDLNLDSKSVTSTIDLDTYRFQVRQRLSKIPCDRFPGPCQQATRAMDQADLLVAQGDTAAAVTGLQQAVELLDRTGWQTFQTFPASAVRGAWHRPVEHSRQAIGVTLDSLKAAGINTVFLETVFHGYTIFPSETYLAYGIANNQNPKFKGFDALQTWLDEAHKRGMKLHPWFQVFYSGTKAFEAPGPVLSKYPEWANIQLSAMKETKTCTTGQPVGAPPASPPTIDATSGAPVPLIGMSTSLPTIGGAPIPPSSPVMPTVCQTTYDPPAAPTPSTLELGGYFLDPANPEVRKFLLTLTEEIVRRYNVDGVQLDYIRYPASFPPDRYSYRKTTWGYTKIGRQTFQSLAGIDPTQIDPKSQPELWNQWTAFKAAQVTDFVREASRRMRTVRPGIVVSAAVFPEAAASYERKHQDWPRWAQEGLVDWLAGMTLTGAVNVVQQNMLDMVQLSGPKVRVLSGVFAPFNNLPAERLLEQIDASKRAGANGYVIFDTAHMTGRIQEALKVAQQAGSVAKSSTSEKRQP